MINKILNSNVIDFTLILLVSLIPLFWYDSGTILLGHDAGWSLVPIERFSDRLWTWTRTGFGYDQSLHIGAITIYALPAFLSFVGLTIVSVQKITFIFWFFSISFSMYILSRSVYKGQYSRAIALIAAIFYSINHYTLQAWTVAELSKFSAMVMFPLMIAILWQTIEGRISLLRGILFASIVTFIFNGGGGGGIPLYGGALITFLLLFFYKWLVEKKKFLKIALIYVAFFITFFLVNAYWLLPLIHVASTQYSPFAQSGGADSAVGWTDVISRNTSFVNLFRLQGFSGWYDESTHPYASVFLNNPLFILGSLIFPLFVFTSIFFAKTRKSKNLVVFFLLLSMLSLFFVAGTHKPFGFIYEWMMKNIYGFAVFQTAFYKFGYALWFSYAFLFAFTVVHLISNFRKRILIILGSSTVLLFVFIYNFPFFTGSFFEFKKPFKTRIDIPTYIENSVDYFKSIPENSRILLIPPPSPVDGQTDIYNFGYFSRTPLPFQLTQKSIVTNVEINSKGQELVMDALYDAILQGSEKDAHSLIGLLGITGILVRNDVLTTSAYYRVTDPRRFVNNLDSFSFVKKGNVFGLWEFYAVLAPISQFSSVSPEISITTGALPSAFLKKQRSGMSRILVSSSYRKFVPAPTSEIIVAGCENCSDKDAEAKEKITGRNNIRFLPTSPFYILTRIKESRNLKRSFNNPYEYLLFLLIYSEKRALEIDEWIGQQKMHQSTEQLDQQQRTKIIEAYRALLKEIIPTYSRLSESQKVTSAKTIVSSLRFQEDILSRIKETTFFDDVRERYFSLTNLLTTSLISSDVLDYYDYGEKHYLYSIDIHNEGVYFFHATRPEDISKATIDGKQIYPEDSIFLSKGKHRMDIPVGETKNLLSQTTVNLDKSRREIKLPMSGLKNAQPYMFSFSIEGKSPIKIEIIDDFGKVLASKESHPSDLTPDTLNRMNVTSRNAIIGPYLLRFTSTDPNQKEPVTIINMNFSEIRYPEVIISNYVHVDKEDSLPLIEEKFISPTEISIKVSQAKDPFVLLFKQSFSPFWEARYKDRESITSHFPADDVFNAWYIVRTGDYSLVISFNAQRNYILGMYISGIYLFLLTFIFVLTLKRKWLTPLRI